MKLDYYFEHIDELNCKDLFNDCDNSILVLNKLNNYIEEMTKDKQINEAVCSRFVSLNGNYIIGKNTKISDFVTINGPVIIGDNVEILEGALIRPYTIIGDDCVIGHSSEVKHSIIMNKAKVASFAFVGDSIIGYKTRIGSGVILANRRFDQGNMIIKKDNEFIDLNTTFFGSIIGDQTRLGANVTAYPKTLIGKDTWIYPHTSIKGFIPSLKRVSEKKELYITENSKYNLD